jgi:hypothetical protein
MKRIKALIISIFLALSVFPTVSAGNSDMVLLPAVANVGTAQKWGYIDLSGKFIIKPSYDSVTSFTYDGIAIAANTVNYDNNTVYFIDKLGKVVSGPYNSYIPAFSNGYATVYEKGKGSKLINEKGKIVLESKYHLEGVSEGLVKFYEEKNSVLKYGYMDLKGKIVIPLKYTLISNFNDGKAWATNDYNKYDLIDKQGKVLASANASLYQLDAKSQLYPYFDEKLQKYGYKTLKGNIAISPNFSEAGAFVDGLAVVSVETNQYEFKKALIDTKGNYVLKPQYTDIESVGQGLYSVSVDGYSFSAAQYNKHALFDNKGNRLSEFSYYNIGTFKGDYASACNDTQTFFIDKTGKIVDKLPVIDGSGSMEFIGDIIKAEVDGTLSYYNKDAYLIWEQNRDFDLGDGITVKTKKLRTDYLNYVEYPLVQGLPNTIIQDTINKKLKSEFVKAITDIDPSEQEYFNSSTHSKNFSVTRNKDLIIVKAESYFYPIGAAHGMPYQEYYHIDLKTGSFYNLKNLFKPQTKYLDRLTSIIRNQLSLEAKMKHNDYYASALDLKPTLRDNIGFTVTEDSLQIYFDVYEIGPYAMGFVTFDIPYGKISDLIDDKGSFWQSFDKKVVKSKVILDKYNYSIDQKTSVAIQNLIGTYEKKLIEAINTNDFKKVEPTLLKGSNLYTAQKKLVSDLFKKNTKEKLVDFEVYAIASSPENNQYHVYVLEDIGIKYSNKKNYETKKFSWCYTVVKDEKTGSFTLSNIEKW